MEEMVWIYVGVAATLIALGAIAGVVLLGNEQVKEQDIDNALNLLEKRSNFVCNAETGTLFSEEVTLGYGVYLYTGIVVDSNNGKICIDYENKTNCKKINCPIQNYDLNLNKEELKEIAYVHKYSCAIERIVGGIKIGCKG